jgi:hypothetical protein
MAEQQKIVDPSIESLRERLSDIDEVAQLILNAHLEIEAEMDYVLRLACFQPEHLERLRLGFYQRAQIARSAQSRSTMDFGI